MPVTAGLATGNADLLTNVEWGPPYGNAYGYRRHHGWRGQGYAYGYGRPQGFYGPRVQSCRTTYVRQWNEWRGGWTTQPRPPVLVTGHHPAKGAPAGRKVDAGTRNECLNEKSPSA